MRIFQAPRHGRWALVVAGLLTFGLVPAAAAAPPTPSAGTAVVDGDPSEWSLTEDRFADLTRGGVADRPVLGGLFLRYDCETETLFGLVLLDAPNHALASRPDAAFLRIGTSGQLVGGASGNDGTPPDFAWVDRDGDFAAGFEASGHLEPGSYTIRSHVLILDDEEEDGYATVDNAGRAAPLDIACAQPTPTPTPTPAPTEEPNPTPTPTPAPTEEPNPTPTATPDGSVAPATGTPATTLPPTDGLGAPSSGGPGWTGLGLALLGMGLLGAGLLLAATSSRSRVVRDDAPDEGR